MKTVINQHMFRHRETASAALNNLGTIIHKLAEEGVYTGQIVQGKQLLGTFRLTYDRKHEASQVNIDLSAFDALSRANVPGLLAMNESVVGQDGYVVFYTSGQHSALHVTLTKAQDADGRPSFDSRKLARGDLIALRLFYPGSYTLTNELGDQQATLTVLSEENGKYRDPSKLEPVRVKLSDKGFDPAKIEQWPLQALVISVDTAAALVVKSVGPKLDKRARRGRD